jgi:hypothetical protein
MKPDTNANSSMGRSVRFAGAALLIPTLLSFAACIVAYDPPRHEAMLVEGGPSGEVVVNEAPPEAPTEVVTVAPSPGLIWVGGYWGWYGGRYVWVSGGWRRPPRPGGVWVGGYWRPRPGGGHVWVQGRWR